MTGEEIRNRQWGPDLEAAHLFFLQEIAAQLADLNTKLDGIRVAAFPMPVKRKPIVPEGGKTQ